MIPWMLKSRLSDADDEPLPVLRPFSALRGSDVTVLIRCYPHLVLLSCGELHQAIIADYPELTEDDILACLAYAADRERRILTAA